MYLLTKYIKRVLWGIAVRLSCIQDAWCLKVKQGRLNSILNVFAELRKETISFVMSDRPSVRPHGDISVPTALIFIKFDIRMFVENLSREFKFIKI